MRRFNNMKRIILLLFIINCSVSIAIAQPPNNLTGLKICIDPGHGGNNAANDRRIEPDPGIVFWESEGNFRKALWLRPLMQQRGATVYLTRETNTYPNDADEPSLSARWQFANANNVHWFHSIHSNAGGGSYTMVLIKEIIATREIAFPQTVPMSSYIYNNIRAKLRTSASGGNVSGSPGVYKDYTFYGGTSGGFNLGVLNGLVMPGQLSEGSFHDGFPEARRLLNNDYRKMEAYGILDGFLQNYGIPKDSAGMIAGIQLDAEGSKPMNGTVVRLLPENKVYNGDQFNNGFYMFDSLQPGVKTIRFETPNFKIDSVTVNVTLQSTSFADRTLFSLVPPKLTLTQPLVGDTNFSVTSIIGFRFSRAMDTASVRSSLTFIPDFAKTFSWTSANTQLVIKPTLPLPTKTNFTITLGATAKGANGVQLDGDGNGTAGDQFVLTFKTGSSDKIAPEIVTAFPIDANTPISPNQIILLQFNEQLDPSSVTSTNVVIEDSSGNAIPQIQQTKYWDGISNGAVNIFTTTPFTVGKSYRVKIVNVKDLSGNTILTPLYKYFSIAGGTYAYTTIDDFNSGITSWMQPTGSGSTIGTVVDSSKWLSSTSTIVPHLSSNTAAARLQYGWLTAGPSWLIREYLSSGTPRSVTWLPANTKLQTYVLGDGSKTRFRFAVDDSVDAFPAGTGTNHEVSPWITIDWIGWKLIEWDFTSTGTWLGNGKIEGLARFDSYQIQYVPDSSAQYGSLYFDQLQLIKQTSPLSVKRSDGIPTTTSLNQNFPNPFNPSTTINFSIAEPGNVSLIIYDVLGRQVAELVNAAMNSGEYSISWDAKNYSSGIYFYKLSTEKYTSIKRMMLVK
ncbi:MAG TPA: hypothetical protein DCQ28_14775 [Bacteroidetes bacterium]|nr:hypothetical protein [Bacteroidota bacterium]